MGEAVEESFDDDGPRRVKMDRDGGIAVMDLRTKKRIRNGASSSIRGRTKTSTSNEDKGQDIDIE